MGMTKAQTEDRTIRPAQEARMVGDVSSIGTSDTAKSGADSPDLSVDKPFIMSNPGFADGKGNTDYIPSVEGDANRAAPPFSAPNAPDKGEGCITESSVNDDPQFVRTVNFPAAADGMSAGGARPTSSFIRDPKGITGAKVAFPSASDTSSAGGGKDVQSFVPSGKDWKS